MSSNYWLPKYDLSWREGLQSLVVSEYGLRHFNEGKKTGRLGHYLVAVIEVCPVLGHLATLIEGIAAAFFYIKKSQEPYLPPLSSSSSEKEEMGLNSLILPHNEISEIADPAERETLEAIQKTMNERKIPLHVCPKEPTQSYPVNEENRKAFLDYCRINGNAQNGRDREKSLLVIEKAVNSVQHISMEQFREALKECVERLNQRLDSNFSIGFVCEKSNQWVSSLALKHLKTLPTSWFSFKANGSHHLNAQLSKRAKDLMTEKGIEAIQESQVVIFDDCSYSGNQIIEALMLINESLKKSLNKKKVFLVIPFTTQSSLSRTEEEKSKWKNLEIEVITSSYRIRTLEEIFPEEELEDFNHFCIEIPCSISNEKQRKVKVFEMDGRVGPKKTLCYNDWKGVPDEISFPNHFGAGIIHEKIQGFIPYEIPVPYRHLS